MPDLPPDAHATTLVDLLVAGLGPGGCVAALAARAAGLHTLAVEARGPQATRSQLVLVRPGARAALQQVGLPDITEGRRTTTIRQVENRLRSTLTEAAQAASTGDQRLAIRWDTSVVQLAAPADPRAHSSGERWLVTLRDEATGACRQVAARHVIDATGGRLEPLGRPARQRRGPSHLVLTAEFDAPPWFEGIVGARDPHTQDLCLLFPTWGRKGVIAYLDAPPGRPVDPEAFGRRFDALAQRLGLGEPQYAPWVVDVYQRALARAADGRVLAIGDSAGTVDVLLGAGMSTAIEDGADAAFTVAAAQRQPGAAQEAALTRQASARIFARHRWGWLRGRCMLGLRPLWTRAWPTASLAQIERAQLGPLPFLWPAVRFVFGRRPRAS